jgi:hypothetical protein
VNSCLLEYGEAVAKAVDATGNREEPLIMLRACMCVAPGPLGVSRSHRVWGGMSCWWQTMRTVRGARRGRRSGATPASASSRGS